MDKIIVISKVYNLNKTNYGIGIFFISLALAIMLYAYGINIIADISIILVIMGFWETYIGVLYFSKGRDKYHLGWGIFIVSIGLLLLIYTYIPEYGLYLISVLLLIIGILIISMTRA